MTLVNSRSCLIVIRKLTHVSREFILQLVGGLVDRTVEETQQRRQASGDLLQSGVAFQVVKAASNRKKKRRPTLRGSRCFPGTHRREQTYQRDSLSFFSRLYFISRPSSSSFATNTPVYARDASSYIPSHFQREVYKFCFYTPDPELILFAAVGKRLHRTPTFLMYYCLIGTTTIRRRFRLKKLSYEPIVGQRPSCKESYNIAEAVVADDRRWVLRVNRGTSRRGASYERAFTRPWTTHRTLWTPQFDHEASRSTLQDHEKACNWLRRY